MCVLHGGTLWNVSCGLPSGVKLLCLFFTSLTSFCCIYFVSFYALNVNITVWGHWIKSEFIHFLKNLLGHTFIFCLCIQYTVVPYFSRQQFLHFLLFDM